MESLQIVERWVRWTGLLALVTTFAFIYIGIAQGLRRPVSKTETKLPSTYRHPFFYVISSVIFFSLCYLGWIPLPLHLTHSLRLLFLVIGTVFFFAGLGLTLWARLALGSHYFVSSAFGAELFEDHRLITHGPYAWVRHPMYFGLIVTCLGGTFLYQTWTFLVLSIGFAGLAFRARREEVALKQRFGEEWDSYQQAVPAWFPRPPDEFLQKFAKLPPGLRILIQVGILFLPSIPAYIWFWPNVEEGILSPAQILVYFYVFAGTIFIARPKLTLNQLGINKKGIWFSVGCGLLLVIGRTLIILSVNWNLSPPAFHLLRVIWELLFYFLLVGVTEEILFRGLIYYAIEDWLGSTWAIWGSSFGFMLWHIFGQGPLVGAATFFYGLFFALLRWRAGGIIGLILIHGLVDFSATQMLPNLDVVGLGRPEIPHPTWLVLGFVLIVLLPLYLWKFYSPFIDIIHLGRKRP